MTSRTHILLSILVGSAALSVAGLITLHRILSKHLALEFHHKRISKENSPIHVNVKHISNSLVSQDSLASVADKKLVSTLNKPGFLSKCAQELNHTSASAPSSMSDDDKSLEKLCNGLDNINKFVIRSRRHEANKH